MSRVKHNLSSGESERETWLVRGPRARSRPWALEGQLFGPDSAIARQKALEALEADLAEEQSELARLSEELRRQASRIAGLNKELKALTESAVRSQPAPSSDAGAEETEVSVRSTVKPDYKLCRCEGFEVDSPTSRVGVVDGLRYYSRIDRPDVLEVRAGPFGRQLLLIPVEDVEQILVDEGRLILRSTPSVRHEYFDQLLARLLGRRHNGSARVA